MLFSRVFGSCVSVHTPEHPCPGQRLPLALRVTSELERTEAPGGFFAHHVGWSTGWWGWCHITSLRPCSAQAGLRQGWAAGCRPGRRTQAIAPRSSPARPSSYASSKCGKRSWLHLLWSWADQLKGWKRSPLCFPMISSRQVFQQLPAQPPAEAPALSYCSARDCAAHNVTCYLHITVRCWKEKPWSSYLLSPSILCWIWPKVISVFLVAFVVFFFVCLFWGVWGCWYFFFLEVHGVFLFLRLFSSSFSSVLSRNFFHGCLKITNKTQPPP